jgi:tRNA pseudouridine38-40 synthase
VGRYKLILEYDGTHLVGWQRQPDGLSAQGLVEGAFVKLGEQGAFVQGAGRTDAGVHASHQVAHVDLTKPWDAFRLRAALNAHLRDFPVSILDVQEADPAFHARFSAKERQYEYRIIERAAPLVLDANRAWRLPPPLNFEAMVEAASLLLGTHDFSTFRASECQASSPIKTLDVLRLTKTNDLILVEVQARSFLHHQVRNIVGSLGWVGRGKWGVQDFEAALLAKDRRRGGPTAPAAGLTLTKVLY